MISMLFSVKERCDSLSLKEIAAQAGVSISTVSRVLNSPNDTFASREVRERIWKIVKETGYVPNRSAQALRQNSGKKDLLQPSGSLVCILARTKHLDDNPFFAQVARVAEQQALQMGYPVLFTYSTLELNPKALTQKALQIQPQGAIVLGHFENERLVRQLERQYKNLVFVGRSSISTHWDQIICDGYEASKTAMEHLLSYGHQKIGYIGETGSEIRFCAYCDILRKKGLPNLASWIAPCDQNNGASAYQAADRLLERAGSEITAVFCSSDIAAIAAIRRFREKGVKLPEQLSVIGMDGIELSGYVSPMLTTVRMPISELGSIAVHTLIARINKAHRLSMKIYLPCQLLRRESVANLNEGSYI